MESKYKIILIILGGLLLAGGIGVLIYGLTSDKNNESDELETGENPYLNGGDFETVNTSGSSGGSGDSDSGSELGGVGSSWGGEITPTFNAENELSNPLTEIRGIMLYPKTVATGGWGYTNVRTSAEVNNDQGWWDPSDNLITTINAGSPVGSVLGIETGVYNGYPYQWFKVKLAKAVPGWFSDYTEGYVRGDTVTFKPFAS